MKKKMNWKWVGLLSIMFLFTVVCIPTQAYAEDEKVIDFEKVAVERTETEEIELLEIYEMLFPEEYHYIVEYKENGVHETENGEVENLVYKSKKYGGVEYELIVLSNGQIFMNYSEETTLPRNLQARGPAYGTYKTKAFTVGCNSHYSVFTISYLIHLEEYDRLLSCNSITGSGFILYPMNNHHKDTENEEGPAYYMYENVKMISLDNISDFDKLAEQYLYDVGVAVGRNQAVSVARISTGVDMWIWQVLYALFP